LLISPVSPQPRQVVAVPCGGQPFGAKTSPGILGLVPEQSGQMGNFEPSVVGDTHLTLGDDHQDMLKIGTLGVIAKERRKQPLDPWDRSE